MITVPVQLPLPFDTDPILYRKPGPESRYTAVARYLREHPGEWRCIDSRPSHESAVMLAKNIRRGQPTVLSGMQATVRRVFEVWACCPGTETCRQSSPVLLHRTSNHAPSLFPVEGDVA